MSTFKKLFGYLWRLKTEFIVRLLLNSLSSLLILVPILMINNFVKDVFDTGNLTKLWLYMGGMLLLVVGAGVFQYFSSILNTRIGEKLIYRLRNDLFLALQRQSHAYFDENRTGDIMAKLTSDTEQSRVFLTNTLTSLLNTFIQMIITVVLMLILNVILTLAIVPICFFIFLSIYFYRIRVRPQYRAVRVKYGKVNSILQENVTGVRVVRAFAQEEVEMKKFTESNLELLNSRMDVIKTNTLFHPAMDAVSNVAMIVIIIVGTWIAFDSNLGGLEVGELVSFFVFIQMILGNVKFLGGFMSSYQQMMAAGDRVVGILEHTSEIVEKETGIKLPEIQGRITFDKMSFAYKGTNRMVLKDISLKIKPGQKSQKEKQPRKKK